MMTHISHDTHILFNLADDDQDAAHARKDVMLSSMRVEESHVGKLQQQFETLDASAVTSVSAGENLVSLATEDVTFSMVHMTCQIIQT